MPACPGLPGDATPTGDTHVRTQTRLTSITAALALGIGAVSAPVLGAPPTDEQIEAALDDYAALTDEVDSFEAYEAAMAGFKAEHPEVLDLNELDARTIERLAPILTATEATARDVLARAASLEAPDTIDGVVAMVNASYIDTYLERRLPEPPRLASILAHDRLHDALGEGYAIGLLEILAFYGEFRPDGLASVRGQVLALGDLMTPDAPIELALGGIDYLQAVDALLGGSPEDIAARERIRTGVAGALRGARARVDSTDEPLLAEMLDDAVLRTDGAFARGTLLGHEAPALDFIWTSDHPALQDVRTLADLKGKVVVLDFWHTECSVCIRTFPKIRALAVQYAEAPVVVLGVTAVRGRHADPDRGLIITEGSPESEFELMREYTGKLNITWPIAFTSQNLYNPEFGVESTPHIVIIDPDGVVRHRALHPDMPMIHKIELIDAILAEFGMPVPKGPGMEEDDGAGAEGGDHDGHDHADHDADAPEGEDADD